MRRFVLSLMRLKNLFPKSNFTRNVLLLASGSAFAQIVNVLASPLVTRLYTPEDFGIFSVYSSILGLLTIISSLKYELAIPIAEDEETAVNILFLCIFILISFIFFITVIFIFTDNWIKKIFNIENFSDFKYYISLGIFLIGLYTIFTQWALRQKDYKSLSKTKYFQIISQNIVRIGLGFFHFGHNGLLLGTIAGESTGITTLFMPFLKKNKYLLRVVKISKIKKCIKKYINFSTLFSISLLVQNVGMRLIPLFMVYLFDKNTVGYYGLAYSVINLPANVISMSVYNVFYGEVANLGKTKTREIKLLMYKLLKRLCIAGLLPFVILLFFGPFLFSLVFGADWYEAGVYARIMAIAIFLSFVQTPLGAIYTVFEKQREQLMLDLLRIFFIISVLVVSRIFLLDSHLFIGLYSIVLSIIYILTLLVTLKILNNELVAYKIILK
jgi:O-antigen/teichoic acid export membrane protein